jgi:hypothetical protein
VESARIRIATCRDSAEAALIRSLLGAHQIAVVVAGEHHAGMLGGLAGPCLALDVWVDRADAERAAELIGSLREGGPDIEPPPDDEGADADDEVGGVVHWGLEQRRRTGAALVLACVVTFGTGHLYAGAYLRAIALAALEIFGLGRLAEQPALGAGLVALAVLADAIGSTLRVRRAIREAQLPAARAVRRR